MKTFCNFFGIVLGVIILEIIFPTVLLNAEEKSWSRWRGPYDTGVATTPVRTYWSDTENVKWKIKLPGKGLSSPVIWGKKVFLTTAIPSSSSEAEKQADQTSFKWVGPVLEHRFEVWCIDKNTGEKLWSKVSQIATPHEGYHPRYGSFASHSPVTDGENLYAYFGSRGVFSYDLEGSLMWHTDLGVKMETHYC